jgi:hypothetical protein
VYNLTLSHVGASRIAPFDDASADTALLHLDALANLGVRETQTTEADIEPNAYAVAQGLRKDLCED